MIGSDYIQRALYDWLRNTPDIVAQLNNNTGSIKEAFFGGANFVYPAVRIENIIEEPIGNGTDHLKLSELSFEIVVFSEKDSSKEASKIARIIAKKLFGLDNVIVGYDDNEQAYFRLIFTDYTRTPAVMRLAERLWRASVIYSARANLL